MTKMRTLLTTKNKRYIIVQLSELCSRHIPTTPSLLSQYYIKDTFGLRTLDEAGKTHIHVVPGVEHLHWPINHKVFINYILPYLKP